MGWTWGGGSTALLGREVERGSLPANELYVGVAQTRVLSVLRLWPVPALLTVCERVCECEKSSVHVSAFVCVFVCASVYVCVYGHVYVYIHVCMCTLYIISTCTYFYIYNVHVYV